MNAETPRRRGLQYDLDGSRLVALHTESDTGETGHDLGRLEPIHKAEVLSFSMFLKDTGSFMMFF